MKSESLVFAVAGMFFGLIAGWLIGSQQSTLRPAALPQAAAAPSSPGAAAPATPRFDQQEAKRLEDIARSDPANATPRTQLANLYFDSEKYDQAIKWYESALELDPTNPDVSTDLGVSYYYTNQPDRALQQFEESLKIDPKHAKTLLNQGIVRAFGKQDLAGAEQSWQQVINLAPESPEGQAAKRALDSLKSAHPPATAAKPGA